MTDTKPLVAEGPAFPMLVRLLISAMSAWVLLEGWRARKQLMSLNASTETLLLLLGGVVVLSLVNLWVWRSRTEVTPTHIHQTWVWDKKVAWRDVSQAKMIYVPGLAWLIAPRLVVRGGSGFVTVFHAADVSLLEAFTHYALNPSLRVGLNASGDTASTPNTL